MNYRRRTGHPGRPFALALLAILALVLLSLIRDVAYSQSVPDSSKVLLKRSSDSDQDSQSCRHVHRYKDQCAFIRKSCEDEESGLLSYLSLYFCDLPHLKPLAFIIIALWTALLFTTIGIAASDFFCINLSTISNILGMSESMAGVTFLAFGNGSPDVFSTFAAIKSNSGSLAVGELIGAAGFITAVVSGSMALVRPFKVATKSFVRDVGFFIVSVAFSTWFLANGYLTMWECVVMVAFYIFYVIFVCVWHWWLDRRRKRRERETAIRSHYTIPASDDFDAEPEYRDDPDDDDRGSRRSYAAPISVNDLNDLERVDYENVNDFADLEDDKTRDKWMGELSSNMRITKPPDGERAVPFTPIRPSLVGALEFRAVLASLQKSRNLQSLPISMRRYSDAPTGALTHQQQQHDENDPPQPTTNPAGTDTLLGTDDVNSTPDVRLALEPSKSGRSRAVSANDAAALHTDRGGGLRRDRTPNFDLLSSSPPRSDPSSSANYGTFQGGQSGHDAPDNSDSSLVDASGPSRGALSVSDLLQPRPPRSRTVDFLAPPDAVPPPNMRKARSANNSPDALKGQAKSSQIQPQRPHLKLPIPHSSSSPRYSPSHSPFLSGLSSKDASRTASFALPPPSSSSGPLFPKEESPKPITWWPYKVLPTPQVLARTLFPTLYGWREKNIWERLLGIASAPSFFLLTITLPIVEPSKGESKLDVVDTPELGTATQDFAKSTKVSSFSSPPPHPHSTTATTAVHIETNGQLSASPDQLSTNALDDHTSVPTSTNREWNRWLVMVQCFTAPYIIVVTIWASASENPRDLIKPTLWSLLGSLLALLFILTTTTPTRPPRWHFMLCFVGFAVAITWISTIAEEVVAVLKTIGVIFNISDAILGLTIFAVGNSLGDLVADITVARLGFPVMALSACFGGPMLNILLGIGLSGLYVTISHARKHKRKHPDEPMKFKPYHIHVSPTLLISAIALLITLVGLLIVVPLNKWRMDKRIGWGLIILWLISTIGNVVVEVTGLIGD